jgi:hypothetical protein
MHPLVTNTADPEVATTEPKIAATEPKISAAKPNVAADQTKQAASNPIIIGPTNDPHPPVNSHVDVHDPTPIYTLLSPPPAVPYNLEEFLTECHIKAEDQRMQVILSHHQIHHWSHFIGSDEAALRDMGLDRGPACALCARARACNHCH